MYDTHAVDLKMLLLLISNLQQPVSYGMLNTNSLNPFVFNCTLFDVDILKFISTWLMNFLFKAIGQEILITQVSFIT